MMHTYINIPTSFSIYTASYPTVYRLQRVPGLARKYESMPKNVFLFSNREIYSCFGID